jgi:hypothetical protein
VPRRETIAFPHSLNGLATPTVVRPNQSSYVLPPVPDTTIGVFWDFENCSLSSVSDKEATLVTLLECLNRVGHIKANKVYSDRTTTQNVASVLENYGFEIVLTPHLGRKNQADMALVVDMCFFASDNPYSTIVLITGDCDFCRAISSLRERNHEVILITPMVANPKLHNEPSCTWNWDLFSGRGFRCTNCNSVLADGRHALLPGVDPIQVRSSDVFFMLHGRPCCVLPIHTVGSSVISAADSFAPDPTNSFFEGYAWQIVHCTCGMHVGWYFTAITIEDKGELPSFWALITAKG